MQGYSFKLEKLLKLINIDNKGVLNISDFDKKYGSFIGSSLFSSLSSFQSLLVKSKDIQELGYEHFFAKNIE